MTVNAAVARLYCLGDPTRGLTNIQVWDEICDPAVSRVCTDSRARTMSTCRVEFVPASQ